MRYADPQISWKYKLPAGILGGLALPFWLASTAWLTYFAVYDEGAYDLIMAEELRVLLLTSIALTSAAVLLVHVGKGRAANP